MKYGDLIQFEPISSVIQLKESDDKNIAQNLVKTYVAAPSMEEKFQKQIVKHLQFDSPADNKALMIIGNYGTGKSHLMSVISSICEDSTEVANLRSDTLKATVAPIAGKFKIIRVEIGAVDTSLADIIEKNTIEKQFKEWGIDFTFPEVKVNHKDEAFDPMMTAFSEKFPGYGLLIIIDEMLDFLRAKNNQDQIKDLNFLRVIGEYCEYSKFRLITGMQESLFDNPEFKFINNTINRIKDRTEIVTIDKTDIKYVVTERLLKKKSDQKAMIRDYLEPFRKYYHSLDSDFENFVDLFPVHPNFISSFSNMIMIEKREVLKTISNELEGMINNDVPAELDLLTIDKYWKKVNATQNVYEGIREVSNCNSILTSKIDSNIKQENYKRLAKRIVDALSVQRLENADVNIQTGLSALELKDNLCLYDGMWEEMESDEPDNDLLTEVESVLGQIMKVTNGQYITRKDDQYFIDVHKNVDYDQQIAAKVETLSNDRLDQYFFGVLRQIMECTDFIEFMGNKIWEYEIQWYTHKMFRRGWLFFGNPDERSTAVPEKDFYLYFLPPFSQVKYTRKETDDEIVFDFKNYDESFETDLKYYAAAEDLKASSSNQTKTVYSSKSDEYLKKLVAWMRNKVLDCFTLTYKGTKKNLRDWVKDKNLREVSGIRDNSTLNFRDTLNAVASVLFEQYFINQAPEYPQFSVKFSSQNIVSMTNDVLKYIVIGGSQSSNVTSILNSLELLDNGKLSPRNSRYAKSILDKLSEKPVGVVLKRSELITSSHGVGSAEFYIDDKYRLEPEFVALILVSLVRSGDIVLTYKGMKLDAANMKNIASESALNISNFDQIERPKDFNPAVIKALFELVQLPSDAYYQMVKNGNDSAVQELQSKLSDEINKLAKDANDLSKGITIWDSSDISGKELPGFVNDLKSKLEKLRNFNTCGKLKNVPYTSSEIEAMEKDLDEEKNLCNLNDKAKVLNAYRDWFSQAANVLPADNNWNVKYIQLDSDVKTAALGTMTATVLTDLEKQMNALKKEFVKEYSSLHSKSRLGSNENTKLSSITQGAVAKELTKLKDIPILSATNLNAITNQILNIKPCDGFVDSDILSHPYCPHCGYNPKLEGVHDIRHELNQLSSKLNDLRTQWIDSLYESVSDPSLQENIELLSPEKQKLVNDFIVSKELPADIESFVEAMTDVFKGMVKKPISLSDIQHSLLSDGKPLTIEELKANFDKMIANICHGEAPEKIRVVLE